LGSEIIAPKCLGGRGGEQEKEELMTVSKERNFTSGLVQICFAKHCS
jgi:hypothetical protein